jgi:hypothetical protein
MLRWFSASSALLISHRGETSGDAIETVIQTFGVHVETAAPYRADWKGIVEQRFRLLHADFAPDMPGYIRRGNLRCLVKQIEISYTSRFEGKWCTVQILSL